ncbi:hypothetical protein BDV12DRAFT_171574 [Aspergillus spectabilis]
MRIKRKDGCGNLLLLSQGTMIPGGSADTSESLPLFIATVYYSRLRSISNLLPQLQSAPSVRRVVSVFAVFAATMEGKTNTDDFATRTIDFSAGGGHITSMISLLHRTLAEKVPTASFVHANPEIVKSGITRGATGLRMWLFKLMNGVVGAAYPDSGEGE